jgi:hypothetical protein
MSEGLRGAVPWAVVATLCLQTAGALVWAGKAQARIDALERRLEGQATVAERLARLETRVEGARESLARIEARLEARR